jgi:hypothetical protein
LQNTQWRASLVHPQAQKIKCAWPTSTTTTFSTKIAKTEIRSFAKRDAPDQNFTAGATTHSARRGGRLMT